MLTIFVLDSTAESRTRIISQINSYLGINSKDHFLLPRLSIRPISRHELKFHAAPDICIVGDQLVQNEMSELSSIRKLLPHTAILVRTTSAIDSLSIIEQMARLGVDDTISESASAFEFFRKIILLARKNAVNRNGKLILIDSGKGGLGVTSVVAGLGECLIENGKTVALIDLDWESQDLSRFLQVRPFINENLQVILDQSRPVTEEAVSQCLTKVWYDEENLWCMAPVSESDELYDPRSINAKIFLSVLEILDTIYDCVIIDAGSIRGSLLRTIYRVADEVVFIVNNDPASLYASVDKITKARGLISSSANLRIIENAPIKNGLSTEILRQEICRAAKVEATNWCKEVIPSCASGARWPGSGSTFYSLGVKGIKNSLEDLAFLTGLIDRPAKRLTASWSTSFLSKIIRSESTINDLPKALPINSAVEKKETLLELPWKNSTSPLVTPAEVETREILDEPLITRAAVSGSK